jgi:hypothetical protein
LDKTDDGGKWATSPLLRGHSSPYSFLPWLQASTNNGTQHVDELLKRAAQFPNWNTRPIANFALSASGVVALADLSTIAQRTAIVGGSSWLDAFALAPGLHYQQAADMLAEDSKAGNAHQTYSAVELSQGKTSTYNITNPATLRYLQRVGRTGEMVTIDVGMMPKRQYFGRWGSRKGRIGVGQRASIWQDHGEDLGWLSHALYLAAPVLTIIAFLFMILLQDCEYLLLPSPL